MSGDRQQLLELLYYSIHSLVCLPTDFPSAPLNLPGFLWRTQYVIADATTRHYIDAFLAQVNAWLDSGEITHLVVIILSKDDGRTLERWTFDVTTNPHSPTLVPAITKNLVTDIAVPNVLKQLTAATTFLPDLPTPAVFKLQAYVMPENETSLSLLSDEWVAVDGVHPFGEDVETQQTLLRGVKTTDREVNLLLTALDD
ncbi:hypothetical protein PIIN_07274 [Serendipita indica DSM 11827]|uniref:HORMA domain-containing protein n=1 Tax=Serendipita indica (strain DSM 11827) TaxID=1109443 RepID=G4TPS6_SERID|nr:hypothetical protein PIIN_07274 [Serendipita indica DSM 11827]